MKKGVGLVTIPNNTKTGPSYSIGSDKGLTESISTPMRRLMPGELAERRTKAMCFNCDDIYRHMCKRMLSLLVDVEEDNHEPSDKLKLADKLHFQEG